MATVICKPSASAKDGYVQGTEVGAWPPSVSAAATGSAIDIANELEVGGTYTRDQGSILFDCSSAAAVATAALRLQAWRIITGSDSDWRVVGQWYDHDVGIGTEDYYDDDYTALLAAGNIAFDIPLTAIQTGVSWVSIGLSDVGSISAGGETGLRILVLRSSDAAPSAGCVGQLAYYSYDQGVNDCPQLVIKEYTDLCEHADSGPPEALAAAIINSKRQQISDYAFVQSAMDEEFDFPPHIFSGHISIASGWTFAPGTPEPTEASVAFASAWALTVSTASEVAKTIISYAASPDDDSKILASRILWEEASRGYDTFEQLEDYYERYHGVIQTGEVRIVPEGQKAAIKHIYAKVYCSESLTAPDAICQIRRSDNDDWYDGGDTTGTIAVDNTTCVGTGTAWSNVISVGDNLTVAFTLPCLAANARVYLWDGASTYTEQESGTDYTASGSTVTFTSAPSNAEYVVAYWDAEPEARVAVGDYIETEYGYHRISSITDATHLVLEWYPQETLGAAVTGTHHPAVALEDGESEAQFGLGMVCDTVQIKLIILPRNSVSSAGVVKPLGFKVEYDPVGSRIKESN